MKLKENLIVKEIIDGKTYLKYFKCGDEIIIGKNITKENFNKAYPHGFPEEQAKDENNESKTKNLINNLKAENKRLKNKIEELGIKKPKEKKEEKKK